MAYYRATEELGFPTPPGELSLNKLRAYVGGAPLAEGCTFIYIIQYLNGENPPGLPKGAADFGFTLEELQNYRQKSITGRALAAHAIDRANQKINQREGQRGGQH